MRDRPKLQARFFAPVECAVRVYTVGKCIGSYTRGDCFLTRASFHFGPSTCVEVI